eukprot:PhM_4_TR17583/c0_g1_i1/m.31272
MAVRVCWPFRRSLRKRVTPPSSASSSSSSSTVPAGFSSTGWDWRPSVGRSFLAEPTPRFTPPEEVVPAVPRWRPGVAVLLLLFLCETVVSAITASRVRSFAVVARISQLFVACVCSTRRRLTSMLSTRTRRSSFVFFFLPSSRRRKSMAPVFITERHITGLVEHSVESRCTVDSKCRGLHCIRVRRGNRFWPISIARAGVDIKSSMRHASWNTSTAPRWASIVLCAALSALSISSMPWRMAWRRGRKESMRRSPPWMHTSCSIGTITSLPHSKAQSMNMVRYASSAVERRSAQLGRERANAQSVAGRSAAPGTAVSIACTSVIPTSHSVFCSAKTYTAGFISASKNTHWRAIMSSLFVSFTDMFCPGSVRTVQ